MNGYAVSVTLAAQVYIRAIDRRREVCDGCCYHELGECSYCCKEREALIALEKAVKL